MNSKKWYSSSTILINLVGIIVIIFEFIVKTNIIPDADVVAIIVALLNIINRLKLKNSKDAKPIEKSLI